MNSKKYISKQEAKELLDKFVILREKIKTSKSKKVRAEYEACQTVCVNKFDYLIISKLRRYKQFPNYEDLHQDARIALIFALNSYKPGSSNFFWWANQYIKTKISREANRHSTIKIPMKKARELKPYKVSELPLQIDESPDVIEIIESKQIKNKVKKAISLLPEDQRNIIERNGIKLHSISKISKDLQISRGICIKLLNQAKQNLKENLEVID